MIKHAPDNYSHSENGQHWYDSSLYEYIDLEENIETTIKNTTHAYPYNDEVDPRTFTTHDQLDPEYFRADMNFEQFYYEVLPKEVFETCAIPRCLPCPGDCERIPTVWCKDYEVPVRPCVKESQKHIVDPSWKP